jgi:transcriptional regulator GlxA family with amidase domain
MGLKEIADACGFGSADSMRRTFLRVLGITAGEYMERFTRDQANNHQRVEILTGIAAQERETKRPASLRASILSGK